LPHKVSTTTFVGHLNTNASKMKVLCNTILILLVAQGCSQIETNNSKKMKVAVWDTYVTKKDGSVMHFDILAPSTVKDTTVIYNFGREYLTTKGQEEQPLTSKECKFCHVESVRPEWETTINNKGYYIIEMENCN
jgi:hypothetical protein